MEGVSNPLINKCIRNFLILRARLNEIDIPEDAKKIQIIELDELFSYCQKTNQIYVWFAVDRVRNQVVDFEITELRDFSSYLPPYLLDTIL